MRVLVQQQVWVLGLAQPLVQALEVLQQVQGLELEWVRL